MRFAMLIGIAAGTVAASACGQSRAEDGGATVQRQYPVGGFQAIEVAGPYEVTVRTGGAASVSASGPERMIERMVVEIKGDRLLIHPRKERGVTIQNFRSREPVRVEVSVPMIRAGSVAGSGGMTVDRIDGSNFHGSVAGSGDLRLGSVTVGKLKLAVAGSGDVEARSGQAQSVEYNIAGSGDIDANGVRAQTAAVSIAGSGNIQGQASGTASVSIMGSGDVKLTGGAKCSVSKMGSGNVRCS